MSLPAKFAWIFAAKSLMTANTRPTPRSSSPSASSAASSSSASMASTSAPIASTIMSTPPPSSVKAVTWVSEM